MEKQKKMRWDEKRKLMTAALACAALLIAAMLLPLAFRRPAEETDDSAVGAGMLEKKTALFVSYWYGEAQEKEKLSVEKLETPGAETAVFCEEILASTARRWIDDRALEELIPSGSEYTVVSDAGGTQLRLCRVWLQAQGDWQNWLDICFDMDTGCLYYLYVSRECLSNPGAYRDAARPGASEIAEELAAGAGGRLRHFSGDGEDGGTALIDTEDGMLCYQISGVYYDSLTDVRINCI